MGQARWHLKIWEGCRRKFWEVFKYRTVLWFTDAETDATPRLPKYGAQCLFLIMISSPTPLFLAFGFDHSIYVCLKGPFPPAAGSSPPRLADPYLQMDPPSRGRPPPPVGGRPILIFHRSPCGRPRAGEWASGRVAQPLFSQAKSNSEA